MGDGGRNLPEGCDCCGHDAEDCGMPEHGWVVDRGVAAGGAVLCRECAHLLHVARRCEACTWCGVSMGDEGRADELGWGFFADAYGVLHACCPGCLARVFGITERVTLGRGADA